MARLTLPRIRPLSRTEAFLVAAIGALMIAYFGTLAYLDRRAAVYFEQTRAADPDLYLRQLRAGRGFEAFLPEYAALKGFEHFTPEPPDFLIGRWTMRDEMLRLVPGERPERCTNPVTFEHGLMLTVEPSPKAHVAAYRIAEGQIEVRLDGENGPVVPIRPVSFGSALDHLEFTPPGQTAPVMAYFCGG
ncbi:MAG: hypothetical protein D6801_01560 [Alphaproteobacteria bacterium]|nr:MAG: hypothetical protein D6801_01560 [Alphaproteobacteria bacterium]